MALVDDWFDGVPKDLTDIYLSRGGGEIKYNVSLTECTGETNIIFKKSHLEDTWYNISFANGILTITYEGNDGPEREAEILKWVNNADCGNIVLTQEGINPCSCYDYKNYTTWLTNYTDGKIPESGLTSGSIVGNFNRECYQDSSENNLLKAYIKYNNGSSVITINCNVVLVSGYEYNIVLDGIIPENTDYNNEMVYSAYTYYSITTSNVECASFLLKQQKGKVPCNCSSVDYFVDRFRKTWPLSGSSEQVFIGSGNTDGCGALSAQSSDNVVVTNVTTIHEVSTDNYSFFGIVNSAATQVSGALNIYFKGNEDSNYTYCKGFDVVLKNGVGCDDGAAAYISTRNEDTPLCTNGAGTIGYSSIGIQYPEPSYSHDYTALCSSDYCELITTDADTTYEFIPTQITGTTGNWMYFRCKDSVCSSPIVCISENLNGSRRTGSIIYDVYKGMDEGTTTCVLSNDKKTATVTMHGGAYYCGQVEIKITQEKNGTCQCCFIGDAEKSIEDSILSDDIKNPTLFKGAIQPSNSNEYCQNDVVYISATNRRGSSNSRVSVETSSITIRENGCGTVEITGNTSSWRTISGNVITFSENTSTSARSGAPVTILVKDSDGNTCRTYTKSFVQLPNYNRTGIINYVDTILTAKQYIINNDGAYSCVSASYFGTISGRAVYDVSVSCKANTLTIPIQLQVSGVMPIAFVCDEYGNEYTSDWLSISTGITTWSAAINYYININKYDVSSGERLGFVCIRRGDTSSSNYVYILRIGQSGGCGTTPAPTCSCNSLNTSVSLVSSSFTASTSYIKIATVIYDSTCLMYSVNSTTQGSGLDITLKMNGNDILALLSYTGSDTDAKRATVDVYFSTIDGNACSNLTKSVGFDVYKN